MQFVTQIAISVPVTIKFRSATVRYFSQNVTHNENRYTVSFGIWSYHSGIATESRLPVGYAVFHMQL
jgi:hypothetical protein